MASFIRSLSQLLALFALIISGHSFPTSSRSRRQRAFRRDISRNQVVIQNSPAADRRPPFQDDENDLNSQVATLKREMLRLGASYDRGFSSTSRARDQAATLISKLEALNQETNAAKGIEGIQYDGCIDDSPLRGSWRLIWTTAADVLILGASPLVAPGAIYQVFEPPIVVNVIDLLPRQQNLLPINQLVRFESLLRAKVQTRASARRNQPMQIGLDFESVEVEPVEFFGMDAGFLPAFGFDLPQLPFVPSTSGHKEALGYFEVLFLDEELLIIRQNSGGLFALNKVDNFDP